MMKSHQTTEPEVDAFNKQRRGYASPAYAESLAEFGEPIMLPRSGGFLLKRRISDSNEYDAMGCYPLFFCDDWSGLGEDLRTLPDDIVSVSLVADPFSGHSRSLLESCFDVVNPFKEHYIVDLDRDPATIGTNHHRKLARRALRNIQVEVCRNPEGFVDDWCGLHRNLVERHGISGIRAFSRRAFLKQLRMPEIIVHQAYMDGDIVGAQLFFQQDGVVHCHLGAVSNKGYSSGAFYALDSFAIRYFSGAGRTLDLGGGSGISVSESDGLVRYKLGWSTNTCPLYFCGRIIKPERYLALTRARKAETTHYFPAYRSGEYK